MGDTYDGPERRCGRRFAIELGLRYRVMLPGFLQSSGTGKSLNISKEGILFAAGVAVQPGMPIEIVVEWPANSEGGVSVSLILLGNVIRIQQGAAQAIAVQFRRYEFLPRG